MNDISTNFISKQRIQAMLSLVLSTCVLLATAQDINGKTNHHAALPHQLSSANTVVFDSSDLEVEESSLAQWANNVGSSDATSNNLNVGLVDTTNTVNSPNVVANGSPKAHDQWDPAPFSDLSTYSSPAVTFALWINDLPGVAPSQPVSITATMVAPNGGAATNYAKCDEPTLSAATATIAKLPINEVNQSSVRITVQPQNNCQQPGQSQVYITITTAGVTAPLAQIYFVTTSGNPLNIGTAIGANDIASQGMVEDKWDPKHLTDGTETDLFSVNSGIKDIVFYLHIPEDRAQSSANPLVLGNEDGVTLPGTPEDRMLAHCTAKGIVKACSAKIAPVNPTPAPDGGIWENQASVNAGLDFSLHVDYGCATNGFVDLLIEIPLRSGFAPISFAWRKACERSPGLNIATSYESALADSPDVAHSGTIRPEWDSRNTSIQDVDGEGDKILKERIFYFWVNPTGTNVKAADFKSTNYTSTPHPQKGATNLVCKPKPQWEIASNFNTATATCTGNNKCIWKAVANIANNAPSDPLQPGAAPLRARFSYSECDGQGAVLLSFEITFGEFDLVRVGWYKFVGTPPGLTLSCLNGCPSSGAPSNGSSTGAMPIIVNGQVNSVWKTTNGPTLGNRILQSSWSLSADETISDYDFSISSITATPSSEQCSLLYGGDIGQYFDRKGNWINNPTLVPGKVMSFDMVYYCLPGNSHKDTFTVIMKFTQYKSVKLLFTKLSTYSNQVMIGTGITLTKKEDVNAEGTPAQKWKTPESACLSHDLNTYKTGCTLDTRGEQKRTFYIDYISDDSSEGSAIIPAPSSSLDPSQQFPGVHESFFFSYNTSDMFGCSPYWDVSQKGAIKNRFDFVKQKQAVIKSNGEPFVLTIHYNCSHSLSRCLKPGACAALFTGFIPVNSMGCNTAKPKDLAPCAYPIFRWIKTVAPIAPIFDQLNLGWDAGVQGGNVTWTIPDSGDGADDYGNQNIKTYNITVQNNDNHEKKSWILSVNNASGYLGKSTEKLFFPITNLTGSNYHLWFNVTNQAGLSTVDDRQITPGAPPPSSNGLPPGTIALIAFSVGIACVVLACLMYHNCIKSGANSKEDPLLKSVQSSSSVTRVPASLQPEEDPYMIAPSAGSEYIAPQGSKLDDADNMLQSLLAAE